MTVPNTKPAKMTLIKKKPQNCIIYIYIAIYSDTAMFLYLQCFCIVLELKGQVNIFYPNSFVELLFSK